MSGDNNRARQRTGGSLVFTAAAIALASAAAVDHIQAQQENRPSAVQNLFRWFTEDIIGLETGSAGPSRRGRRMSRADIAELPTRTYGERPAGADARDEKCFCAVCQESFLPRDNVMRLPCFHEYHTDCITSALQAAENPLCPVCRHSVLSTH